MMRSLCACLFRVEERRALVAEQAECDETNWSPLKPAAQVVWSTPFGNAAQVPLSARKNMQAGLGGASAPFYMLAKAMK